MNSFLVRWALVIGTLILFIFMACADKLTDSLDDSVSLPEHVDFNFHIKPILSDRCFTCHGPDEGTRKADLRLDLEEEAFAKLKSGHGRAFHPKRPDKSESLKRMKSDDPDYQMPPPESNLSLSDQEIALLESFQYQDLSSALLYLFV